MAFRKVNEFKEVSLVYKSNGAATFQFYTDMPGNALAARKGAGVAMPSTSKIRKPQTIPLDNIEGVLFYPEVTPSAAANDDGGDGTQLQVLEGVLWYRPIGVYLDGSQGEVWRTQPLAPGV